jgi:hypothetical protein
VWIIKNHDEAIGFYTGSNWSTDQSKAKQYPTEDAAKTIIRQHRMKADAVQGEVKEDGETQPPQE